MQFKGNDDGNLINQYAGRNAEGEYSEGTISVEFLDKHFGNYRTLDECIAATESEGLKMFFEHLKLTQ